MKKLILSSFVVASSVSFAQVNVSTAPENKTAVLEEYTGNYCTYCPEGHMIADDIEASADAITLKIQTGGFSATDPIFGGTLQTATGNTIAGPYDTQGYPNGTVNRRTAYAGIGRGEWAAAVNTINGETAPVNLYIESSIDASTGELNVSVEYYYTSDEANAENYLHIGYYQDNIPAYQYDPGFYPSQFYILEEGLYQFDHCFRDMVNGAWGEPITTTTTGSTDIVNHTITLPADFGGFEVEAGAIKVFAYMTTSDQGEILNAEKITPAYTNFPTTDESKLVYISPDAQEGCIGQNQASEPIVLVGNVGSNDLTAITAEYGVNGTVDTDTWSGLLSTTEKEAVTLASTSYTMETNNTLDVELTLPNGAAEPTPADNVFNTSFAGADQYGTEKIRIEVSTDQWANTESEFNVYDGAGALLLASGLLPSSTVTSFEVDIPNGTDCYRIELLDGYGDAWGVNADGWMEVYDISQGANSLLRTISAESTEWSDSYDAAMGMSSEASIAELGIENVSVYPNPADDVLNVSFNATDGDYEVAIYDLSGRVLITQNHSAKGTELVTLPVKDIVAGSYIVSIQSEKGAYTENIVIK